MPDFDFRASDTVDDIEKVPEMFRTLYEKTDKGYSVAAAHKGVYDTLASTTDALNKTRSDKKTASDEAAERRRALKAYEDILAGIDLEDGEERNADGLKKYLERVQTAVQGGEKIKIDLNKIRSQSEARIAEVQAEADKRIQAMEATVHRHLVADQATRALAEENGSVALLLPHVERQVKVVNEDGQYQVRVVDAQGDFRSNGRGGWLTIKELVQEMRKTDEFGAAFKSTVPAGTGAKPGASMNRVPPQKTELTPVDKISSGLRRGAYVRGVGAGMGN